MWCWTVSVALLACIATAAAAPAVPVPLVAWRYDAVTSTILPPACLSSDATTSVSTVGGVVFYTCNPDAGVSQIVALNASTGVVLWHRALTTMVDVVFPAQPMTTAGGHLVMLGPGATVSIVSVVSGAHVAGVAVSSAFSSCGPTLHRLPPVSGTTSAVLLLSCPASTPKAPAMQVCFSPDGAVLRRFAANIVLQPAATVSGGMLGLVAGVNLTRRLALFSSRDCSEVWNVAAPAQDAGSTCVFADSTRAASTFAVACGSVDAWATVATYNASTGAVLLASPPLPFFVPKLVLFTRRDAVEAPALGKLVMFVTGPDSLDSYQFDESVSTWSNTTLQDMTFGGLLDVRTVRQVSISANACEFVVVGGRGQDFSISCLALKGTTRCPSCGQFLWTTWPFPAAGSTGKAALALAVVRGSAGAMQIVFDVDGYVTLVDAVTGRVQSAFRSAYGVTFAPSATQCNGGNSGLPVGVIVVIVPPDYGSRGVTALHAGCDGDFHAASAGVPSLMVSPPQPNKDVVTPSSNNKWRNTAIAYAADNFKLVVTPAVGATPARRETTLGDSLTRMVQWSTWIVTLQSNGGAMIFDAATLAPVVELPVRSMMCVGDYFTDLDAWVLDDRLVLRGGCAGTTEAGSSSGSAGEVHVLHRIYALTRGDVAQMAAGTKLLPLPQLDYYTDSAPSSSSSPAATPPDVYDYQWLCKSDDTVFFIAWEMLFAVQAADFGLRWSVNVHFASNGIDVQFRDGARPEVACSGRRVCFTTAASVRCYSTAAQDFHAPGSLEVFATYPTNAAFIRRPLLWNDNLYVASMAYGLEAYAIFVNDEPASKKLWTADVAVDGTVPPLPTHQGVIAVTTASGSVDAVIYGFAGINGSTGAVLWRHSAVGQCVQLEPFGRTIVALCQNDVLVVDAVSGTIVLHVPSSHAVGPPQPGPIQQLYPLGEVACDGCVPTVVVATPAGGTSPLLTRWNVPQAVPLPALPPTFHPATQTPFVAPPNPTWKRNENGTQLIVWPTPVPAPAGGTVGLNFYQILLMVIFGGGAFIWVTINVARVVILRRRQRAERNAMLDSAAGEPMLGNDDTADNETINEAGDERREASAAADDNDADGVLRQAADTENAATRDGDTAVVPIDSPRVSETVPPHQDDEAVADRPIPTPIETLSAVPQSTDGEDFGLGDSTVAAVDGPVVTHVTSGVAVDIGPAAGDGDVGDAPCSVEEDVDAPDDTQLAEVGSAGSSLHSDH
jgi:hypothetical protein